MTPRRRTTARGRRSRGACAIAAATLALLGPVAASAQMLSLEAGTGIVRAGAATTGSALILAPRVGLDAGASSLTLQGQFSALAGGALAADLFAAGAWQHPLRRTLTVGVSVDGRWSAFPEEQDAAVLRTRLRSSLGTPALGIAASIGAARFGGPADGQTTVLADAAGWIRLGPLRIQASAAVNAFDETFVALPDTLTTVDSVAVRDQYAANDLRSRHYTDVEVTAKWRSGRVTLEMAGGVRFGDAATAAEGWGRATGTYALRPGLALTAAAGVEPARIEPGLRRAPFGRIGVRFSRPAGSHAAPAGVPAARPSLVVRDAGDGNVMLRVRIPGARRVEIKGDFTDWKPAELAAAGGGFWELQRRIAPGTASRQPARERRTVGGAAGVALTRGRIRRRGRYPRRRVERDHGKNRMSRQ